MSDSAKKILIGLSGQAGALTIPRLYAEFMGGLDGGLFLNQLVFWSDKGKRADGFIYKSRPEWTDETTLSDYALRKATKELKRAGLLETKVLKANGAPTLHYRLNLDALIDALVRFVDSANGNVENDDSESLKSTDDGNVEIDKSITEPNHTPTQHDGGGVLSSEQTAALDALQALPKMAGDVARRLAGTCDPETVKAWCAYALQADGLRNPAGLVVDRLQAGVPAPIIPIDGARAGDGGGSIAAQVMADIEAAQEAGSAHQAGGDRASDNPAAVAWDEIKSDLQHMMTRGTWATWIKPTVGLELNGSLVVGVPNDAALDWIQNRLRKTIDRAARDVARLAGVEPVPVEFVVREA